MQRIIALAAILGAGAALAEPPESAHVRADERGVALDAVDWQVLIDMREAGDRPDCPRRYDHILDRPDPGGADRAGLVAEIEALEGWSIDPYPGEAVYPLFTGPGTAQELARQLALLEEIAARHGYRHGGWGAVITTGC